MARDYSKVSPSVWQQDGFWQLPTDADRFLFLYLLTNSHQNSAGCYALPDGYAATDLHWTPAQYRAGLGELIKVGLVDFDADRSEIQIVGWFDSNPPMNAKHFTGTKRLIDAINSPRLRDAAHAAIDAVWADAEGRRAERALGAMPQTQRSMLLTMRGGKKG